MGYILHKGGEGRFVLQSSETGVMVGLLIEPLRNESVQMFSYDFGQVYLRKELLNVEIFPELNALKFFAIEYPGLHDFDRYLQHESWQLLYVFLLAEAKSVAYNACRTISEPLPEMWSYKPENPRGLWKVPAFGLWIDEMGCWMGNRDGLLVKLDEYGKIVESHQLENNLRCMIGSKNSLYASCDNGKIYDLTSSIPKSIYNINYPNGYSVIQSIALDNDHLWLLDLYANLVCLTSKFQVRLQKKLDIWVGWFFHIDEQFIYIGHKSGLSCYKKDNAEMLWQEFTVAPVLSGTVKSDKLFLGTSDGRIYVVSKEQNLKLRKLEVVAKCKGSVYAISLSEDGEYIFATDHLSNLYSFTSAGHIVSEQKVGCGAILSLKVFKNRLYGTTTDGILACFSTETTKEFTIQASKQTTKQRIITTPLSYEVAQKDASASAVVLECVKQGGKLKVRPVSDGYRKDWNVQFPQALRIEGVRYLVDSLQEAKEFYRVVGKIRRIDQ
ncbi:MAG: hypothetical protein JNN15_07825 [Blastocatellia bacterium]|nr:hypothetical protein [Blastocatellia bacterium]